MSMYLVHALLTFWIRYFLYGTPDWRNGHKIDWNFPAWAIPVHITLSVLLGFILTFLVEEPARVWLNQWRKKTTEIKNSDPKHISS